MNIVKIDYTLPSYKLTKEELKKQVDEQVLQLKNDVELDTNDKLRKAVRSLIRNYDDQRKDITRKWDERKKAFMSDVKYALDEAIELDNTLTKEIDEEEQLRVEEKIKEIEALDDYAVFSKYNQITKEWLNKTTSIASIKKEMALVIDEFKGFERIIDTTCAPYELNADKYKDMLKQSQLDVIINRIHEDAAVLKEHQEKLESEPTKTAVSTDEPKGTFTIRLTATKTQRDALKSFMAANGIVWELLK